MFTPRIFGKSLSTMTIFVSIDLIFKGLKHLPFEQRDGTIEDAMIGFIVLIISIGSFIETWD